MKNIQTSFAKYEFKKGSEVVEVTKILSFRKLWTAKAVDMSTLPQADIMSLVKDEITHESLFKILELSEIELTQEEFTSSFGSWYKI
jgi:hypothetical protein